MSDFTDFVINNSGNLIPYSDDLLPRVKSYCTVCLST